MNGTLSSASDRDTGNLVRERANAALFVRYGTWRVRTYGVRNMRAVESVQIYYVYFVKKCCCTFRIRTNSFFVSLSPIH